MRPAPPHSSDDPIAPDAAVVAWRIARLREAGVDPRLAQRLAGDCGYDLHALIDLVERGCPPALAARILAPLPGEERRC
jgi:hypothetical protein